MTVDHQASQPWLQPCRAHASARWRQFGTDLGASGDRHEYHDPARVSRPEGRAVDRMSRAGPPAHQMPRILGSSTLWCAPPGVHWIEADFSRVGGRPQQQAGRFKTQLKYSRRPGGSMGASAALGRSDVQNLVMCHSECVVWLMMGFVCVFEIEVGETYIRWHGT